MKQKSKTVRRGWIFLRWRNIVRTSDIPRRVALGKISRSILEDDLTLESGDIFTHSTSSSQELDDVMVPPCRLRHPLGGESRVKHDSRQPNGPRGDSSSIRLDNDDDDNDEITIYKGTIHNHKKQKEFSTVSKFTLLEFGTAPFKPWVCW